MDFIQFLDTLELTLDEIEVHGKSNLIKMLGSMQAIDKMRIQIKEGGEVDGRQTDIGTDSGNDSNEQ